MKSANEPVDAGERSAKIGARVGTDELSVLRLEGFATSTPRQEPPMNETPISDLRRRMLEDKAVCNFIERLLGPPNEGAEN